MGSYAPSLLDLSPWQLRLRKAKVWALQGRRLLKWATDSEEWPSPHFETPVLFQHVVYKRRIRIARGDEAAHPVFEHGKRINLQLAAPAFDGLLLAPNRPFSFWRTLGKVTAARGFTHGMEIQGGCIVPALGGGLCLLSNALFRMAVEAGCILVERHAHSVEAIPPSPQELWGLDATVFWPYVDLRFVPRGGPFLLSVQIDGEELCIGLRAAKPASVHISLYEAESRFEETSQGRFRENRIRRKITHTQTGNVLADQEVVHTRKRLLHNQEQKRSCLTCKETSCHAREGFLKVL